MEKNEQNLQKNCPLYQRYCIGYKCMWYNNNAKTCVIHLINSNLGASAFAMNKLGEHLSELIGEVKEEGDEL